MPEAGKKAINQLRLVLNDAYAFVRSYEINRALSNISIEDLINEHIDRIGTSEVSEKNKFDPYADPSTETANDNPAPVTDGKKPGNFVSGTDMRNMTKRDRILKMQAALVTTLVAVKGYDPKELADAEDHANAAEEIIDSVLTQGGAAVQSILDTLGIK